MTNHVRTVPGHTAASQRLLWTGLGVGLVANGALSLTGAPVWLSAPVGAGALACAVVLVVRKVRAAR
ncbi:hypothetical protein J4H86_20415 [Spiractinospora alimapuensis]|uniref:hypothetical protein n=1 Tax=Spiractinospora alimapuensis TaxID=2820884 RepID=UPI001F15D2B4|nr:hypothetical protein [Spiractinospora alimapuensis]QVQ51168.1 hypothetical protein J4H86_20415 [Spiractinospora alimapuensis]